jgi:hypothetical protein
MRRLSAAFFILLGLANAALAQSWPNPSIHLSITGTVAAQTQLIAAPAGKQIVVTTLLLTPLDTSVVAFTYGTGTNCGTGTGSITGAMTFGIGKVVNLGNGEAPVMIVPPGNDLCIIIQTAAAPGSLVYTLVP